MVWERETPKKLLWFFLIECSHSNLFSISEKESLTYSGYFLACFCIFWRHKGKGHCAFVGFIGVWQKCRWPGSFSLQKVHSARPSPLSKKGFSGYICNLHTETQQTCFFEDSQICRPCFRYGA